MWPIGADGERTAGGRRTAHPRGLAKPIRNSATDGREEPGKLPPTPPACGCLASCSSQPVGTTGWHNWLASFFRLLHSCKKRCPAAERSCRIAGASWRSCRRSANGGKRKGTNCRARYRHPPPYTHHHHVIDVRVRMCTYTTTTCTMCVCVRARSLITGAAQHGARAMGTGVGVGAEGAAERQDKV